MKIETCCLDLLLIKVFASLIAAPRPFRERVDPIPTGALDPWGSIRKFMGDTNVCDIARKEAIDKQIMTMILRSGLPLGFAENPHFPALIELLCP